MVTEVPILPVGRYDNQIFIHGHDVAETLHFLLHQVPVPVTGIIARQEPAGDDPVAAIKRGVVH